MMNTGGGLRYDGFSNWPFLMISLSFVNKFLQAGLPRQDQAEQ
jgi:hypothetical protein